jgi:hypothetical protein
MTRRKLLGLASAALTACGLDRGARGQMPDPFELRLRSRRRALEAARRLGADGWRVRDGVWAGRLGEGKRHAVPIHLIGGNSYLFVLAIRPINPNQVFSLLDGQGRLVAEKSVASDPGLAAVLYDPASSGLYHLFVDSQINTVLTEVAAAYLYR